MTQPTPAALALGSHIIRAEEGFRAAPYWDAAARCWSVGYGMCEYADGTTVGPRTRSLTPAEAEAQLQDKLARQYVQPVMRSLAGIALTDGQCAALLSLAWNAGPASVTWRELPALLRRGDLRGALAVMRQVNTSRGVVVPVLVARRQREGLVFAGGPYRPAPASPSMAEIEGALGGKAAVPQTAASPDAAKWDTPMSTDDLNARELARVRG